MAISRVRVQINGTWTTLTSSDNVTWTGSVTAPSVTSYNLTGGVYPVTVEATNSVGTTTTVTSTDATFGANLKLKVKEKVKPTITLSSPAAGAYSTNNKQPITFTVTDETSGSGINLSTVKLKIDSTEYTQSSTGMSKTAVTNGYQFVYTPQTALSDGSHTITINVSDNDGNAADTKSSSFKIDTVPPTLNVVTPTADLQTGETACTVTGTTNDATSSPVSVVIKLNGTSVGTVTVGSDGSFSKQVTLSEGANTIVVTATDSAGKSSTVTRNVLLDTSVPEFKAISISPNPADASGTITITVEVE